MPESIDSGFILEYWVILQTRVCKVDESIQSDHLPKLNSSVKLSAMYLVHPGSRRRIHTRAVKNVAVIQEVQERARA